MMSPSQTDPTYETIREYRASLNGVDLVFISKKGFPDWEHISPASELIAEHIHLSPDQRVLLLGCGHGALGAALARRIPQGEIWLADTNSIALEMSRRTLQANSVENARLLEDLHLPVSLEAAFDVAAILLPKGRKLVRRWLLEAHAALRSGGSLYLAGPNALGIQPAIRDAESIFGNATILGYRKGNRVARLVKPVTGFLAPEWAGEPGIRRRTWYDIQVEGFEEISHLHSLPGVFSYDRLDEGSRLLLARLKILPGDTVLDLGCGYGILGLVAAKSGAQQVDLVDANLLAVASARENISLLHLDNAQALPSDVTSAVATRRYSLVITNPPFHTGRGVDYDIAYAFIAQAHHVLLPGGRFILVCNRFIRYEPLHKQLFHTVERIAETGKYQVYQAVRKPA